MNRLSNRRKPPPRDKPLPPISSPVTPTPGLPLAPEVPPPRVQSPSVRLQDAPARDHAPPTSGTQVPARLAGVNPTPNSVADSVRCAFNARTRRPPPPPTSPSEVECVPPPIPLSPPPGEDELLAGKRNEDSAKGDGDAYIQQWLDNGIDEGDRLDCNGSQVGYMWERMYELWRFRWRWGSRVIWSVMECD